MTTVTAADLFCGAGGTSMGMGRACRDLGLGLDLLAVNHWPIAIETHSRNHPAARHLCESLDSVDPRKVVPGGKLNLLVASPECTHHSRARGSKPVNDQSRASGWHVPRWLDATDADAFILENVPEWEEWGPTDSDGHPIKSRKGETFRALMSAIRSLGHTLEVRTLCAADYGDATTRRRLFVLGRRDGFPIRWPEPTHGKRTLFSDVKPWRAAREVIDWSLPGKSIFGRKKPLAPKTMARIVEGLKRFGGPALEPFLLTLTHGGRLHDLDVPFPTITGAHRGEIGVVEPFFLSQASGGAPRRVSEPMPTLCGGGAVALVDSAFLVPNFGERPGQTPRTHSLDEPLPVVTSHGAGGLVQPFLVAAGGPTGKGRNPKSVDRPLDSILTENHSALVEPFLTKYYGTATVADIAEPLDTITARDRFGLVTPLVFRAADGSVLALDIRFRMLQPHELAGGMSFDPDYFFAGNKSDQTKQIGNAVPGELSRALCRAQLAPFTAGYKAVA